MVHVEAAQSGREGPAGKWARGGADLIDPCAIKNYT